MDVVADVAPGLGHGTVWLLETGSAGSADDDVAALQRAGFTQVSRTDVHRTIVYEFRKGTS
jgi:mannosyltransferase